VQGNILSTGRLTNFTECESSLVKNAILLTVKRSFASSRQGAATSTSSGRPASHLAESLGANHENRTRAGTAADLRPTRGEAPRLSRPLRAVAAAARRRLPLALVTNTVKQRRTSCRPMCATSHRNPPRSLNRPPRAATIASRKQVKPCANPTRTSRRT